MATPATAPPLPPKPKLSHRAVANAQVGLSYFVLTGFFILLVLQGMKKIQVDVAGNLKEAVALIIYFWFQRTRDSSSEAPAAGTLTGHQVPPSPSGVPAHVQPVTAEPAPITIIRPATSPPSAPTGGTRPTI